MCGLIWRSQGWATLCCAIASPCPCCNEHGPQPFYFAVAWIVSDVRASPRSALASSSTEPICTSLPVKFWQLALRLFQQLHHNRRESPRGSAALAGCTWKDISSRQLAGLAVAVMCYLCNHSSRAALINVKRSRTVLSRGPCHVACCRRTLEMCSKGSRLRFTQTATPNRHAQVNLLRSGFRKLVTVIDSETP